MSSTIEEAQSGDPWKQFILGRIYSGDSSPLCVAPNFEEAYFWLSLAGKNGQPDNAAFSGYWEKTVQMLSPEQIAVVKHRVDTWRRVSPPVIQADCFPCASRPSRDPEPSAALVSQAQNGDLNAQMQLGRIYWAHEWTQAMKWYRMAADQGNLEAIDDIGRMYEKGWGVTQDDTEAARWYQIAAIQDNSFAQHMLADMYFSGRGGLGQDLVLGYFWHRMGGENEKALSSVAAKMTPEQLAKAKGLASIAESVLDYRVFPCGEEKQIAALNRINAEEAIWSGTGDFATEAGQAQAKLEEAARLIHLIRRAEAGDTAAQYMLSALYGGKLPQNLQESYFWLSLAASCTDLPTLKTKLSKLAERLTPEQIAAVNERVRVWKPAVSKASPDSSTQRP